MKKKEKVSIFRNGVLVIGASRLGAYIAMSLQQAGRNVTVIDKDQEAFDKLEDFQGFTVVGDATDLNTLESNEIKRYDMVIVTTDDDNSNLFIGDVCNTIYEVPKIYIRLNDSDKVKLLVDSKIKAICPFLLSVEKFYEVYNE